MLGCLLLVLLVGWGFVSFFFSISVQRVYENSRCTPDELSGHAAGKNDAGLSSLFVCWLVDLLLL